MPTLTLLSHERCQRCGIRRERIVTYPIDGVRLEIVACGRAPRSEFQVGVDYGCAWEPIDLAPAPRPAEGR